MTWLAKLLGRKPAPAPSLWTGRVLSAVEFQTALGTWEPMADQSYAVVNSAALPAYYDWFRARLFDLGVTRWDAAFDCDNWSRLYADLLNARFYLAQWDGGRPPAESAAVACFWYRPAAGPAGHAICALHTEAGLQFIEPQDGRRLTLTPDEIASHFRVMA